MSGAWAGGSTSAWRRVRAFVLLRDQYRCRIALPGVWVNARGQKRKCAGTADCVHHLDGKAKGDDHERMIAACTPCNLRVGDPTTAADPPGRGMTRW